ncbi:MAG: hypothetical protein ABIJ56_06330 [Pseudomonadota bacterium]
MNRTITWIWRSFVFTLVLSIPLCLGNCTSKDKQPEEGDPCDSYLDAFCLDLNSPFMMSCHNLSYYIIIDCRDSCAEDGMEWNGECSYYEERGRDVCWCTDTTPAGTQVGDLPMYVEGEKSPDPMPTPTSYGDEPVISGYTATATSGTTFKIEFDVISPYPVTKMHMEMNGEHYIADIEPQGTGEVGDIDACQILADATGITCTQACVDACTCVTCSDSTIQSNIRQACSVGCSTSYAQGGIGPGQTFASEVDAADKIVNGYSTVPGLINGMPCSGSVCSAVNTTPPVEVRFNLVSTDYSFLDGWETGCLVAESLPPEPRPSISPDPAFPPNGLRTDVKSCFGP